MMSVQELSAQKEPLRYVQVAVIWLVLVVGVPFIILAVFGGVENAFRSGDASIFVSGVMVAAIGESVIEQFRGGFSQLKELKPRALARWVRSGFGKSLSTAEITEAVLVMQFLSQVLLLPLLVWNLYFAARDKSLPTTSVDWVQVWAFETAVNATVLARFSVGYLDDLVAFVEWWLNSASKLGIKIGTYRFYRPQLRSLRRRVHACERALGPEHPDTLNARAELADLMGEAGDPAAARDQYAKLFPIYERVLGPEHNSTLNVRSSLAHWTGRAGDPDAARDQYAKLLPIYERVLGPENIDTLSARANFAGLAGEAGDPAAARDQYAKLLPIYERKLGPENLLTLHVRSSLAHWTGRAGDLAAARDQYAKLLPIYERVLGPENIETLGARDNLARLAGEAGDPAEARDQYAKLLPIYERIFGPEGPTVEATRANLVYWTEQAEVEG